PTTADTVPLFLHDALPIFPLTLNPRDLIFLLRFFSDTSPDNTNSNFLSVCSALTSGTHGRWVSALFSLSSHPSHCLPFTLKRWVFSAFSSLSSFDRDGFIKSIEGR